MATLFDIDKAIAEFEWEIDPDTGEVLNPYGLDELQMEREQKCENIALLIKNKTAEKEAVEEQKKVFDQRAKVLGNEIQRLKDYLTYALDGQKFSTPKVVVGFRKSESVLVKDKYLIPDHYMNLSVVREPNKTAIKNALKRGEAINGVELVEKQNVQVK